MHIPTPHTVVLFRPKVGRDADTNATVKDYVDVEKVGELHGMCQTRTGSAAQGTDGQIYSFDAQLYLPAGSEQPQVDDLIDVDIPGLKDRFSVKAVDVKHDLRGRLSHLSVAMAREQRR